MYNSMLGISYNSTLSNKNTRYKQYKYISRTPNDVNAIAWRSDDQCAIQRPTLYSFNGLK